MSPPTAVPAPRYAERLACPASWWVISLLVGLSTVTAVGWYVGPEFAAAAAVVCAAAIAGVLGGIGSVRVVVDDRGLVVGPSLLEWQYQGPVEALDAAATRDRLGVGADARAFVVQRTYLKQAVEVPVRDAADPHPYWLVSTRSPARLAAALAQGRAAHEQAATA